MIGFRPSIKNVVMEKVVSQQQLVGNNCRTIESLSQVRGFKSSHTGRDNIGGKSCKNNFIQLGLKEAGTFKSSSILIYSHQEQSIYTQNDWREAVVIKR
jgi:hypothetical protein